MTLDAIITVIDAKHLERHLSTGDTAAASTHKVPPYPPPLLRVFFACRRLSEKDPAELWRILRRRRGR